jgi:hypothetical protein
VQTRGQAVLPAPQNGQGCLDLAGAPVQLVPLGSLGVGLGLGRASLPGFSHPKQEGQNRRREGQAEVEFRFHGWEVCTTEAPAGG